MNKDKQKRQWQEVEEYRSLLEAPNRFEEGFTIRTILGVIFISLIMTPGEMYLGLFTGGGIGAAAQWVTVILFLEVAKRSFSSLRRQEIYLLVYVASALVAREEGAFLDLLWRQYFVRSAEAEQFGISRILPWWWAPSPDSEAIAERTFFHRDWLWPIVLLMAGTIMGRIAWFTSGYLLFRLTSDREQLPFPTAPMSALSAMALAEESGEERETWKWPVFSIGAVIGAAFGTIYVGVPSVTQIWGTKIELLPIPFWDLTPYLGAIMKATPLGITLHLGPIFSGLLMPFWAVIGAFGGVMVHTFASPLLHQLGYLPRWELGMDTIRTQIATGIDFWRAFSIGITIAVTIISFYQLFSVGRQKRAELREQQTGPKSQFPDICKHADCNHPAEVRGYCLKHLGRGDFNVWICVALFCVAAMYPIFLAKTLFPTLVSTGLLVIFVLMAFVYAPILSFVSARLDGLIGKEVAIPYVDEAIRFLTGFRGVEIWFVPFPARNFGGHAEGFRVVELTGMKFTSLLKAELFMLPIVFGVSLMYWTFLWRLAPIPSESYPYAQLMWPLRAFDQALYLSSTMYSKMWRGGEEVEGEILSRGQAVWSPSNLQDRRWWYWRVRSTGEVEVPDPQKREYGEWSRVGYFYTDFSGREQEPDKIPAAVLQLQKRQENFEVSAGISPTPQQIWPLDGSVVSSPNPNFRVSVQEAGEDTVDFYFEVDRLPTFDGEFLQRSSDRPLLFEVLWEDLKYTGDGKDDDGDQWIEALVKKVEDGKGGSRLGLQEGDRLCAIEGNEVKIAVKIDEWREDEVKKEIEGLLLGSRDSLLVEFERQGKVRRGKVARNHWEELGVDFAADTAFVTFLTDYEDVSVKAVDPSGLGSRLGLQAGDRLKSINGREIQPGTWKPMEVRRAIEELIEDSADSLLVELESKGERISRKIAWSRDLALGVEFMPGAEHGVDEELANGIDDDGDGRIDEDIDHPSGGKKWPIIVFGAGFGLTAYFVLSFLGMPIFLIWGYVQSVNGIPHTLVTQIIGALLARFYFWKRYGKQQWRQYAMVLAVGFGVGMSLIGMFCAALAMIVKAVSSLMY